MNRRGLALIVSLWLIVLLAGLSARALGAGRSSTAAARNRLALMRGSWAIEACFAIAQARAAGLGPALQLEHAGVDSVDLGGDIWCRTRADDPQGLVNLNLATANSLARLLGQSPLVAQVVSGRPWPSADAVPQALDPSRPFLTVRGDGRINVNRASVIVLAAIPGVDPDAARALASARRTRPFRTPEEVLAALPGSARERALADYVAFASTTAFEPEEITLRVEGHAPGTPVAAAIISLIPANGRLALLRWESE